MEVKESLPDGADFNAVWSYLPHAGAAKLVTVHFFDRWSYMQIEGKRIQRTRLIQKGRFVVSVETEMIIPDEDSSEPCYEPETVELLRQIAEHAERGDVEWLRRHGKVYELLDPVAR
ncbi:MAG: hypothetical protein ABSF26_12390 [Thermoguttaceae bacterium]